MNFIIHLGSINFLSIIIALSLSLLVWCVVNKKGGEEFGYIFLQNFLGLNWLILFCCQLFNYLQANHSYIYLQGNGERKEKI